MCKTNALQPCILSLEEISDYHTTMVKSFTLYYSDINPNSDQLFFGYSQREVDTLLTKSISELNHNTSLSLLAMLEAIFQTDSERRVKKRLKDVVSKSIRHKKRMLSSGASNKRMSFEKDILRSWVAGEPRHKKIITEVMGTLKYRHWLAHGRYWCAKLGKKYDYETLYEITSRAINTLDLRTH